MAISLWGIPNRITAVIFMMSVIGTFCVVGCDQEPKQTDASPIQVDIPQIESPVHDQGAGLSYDDFMPSPMQAGEYTDYVQPTREPIELVLHCPLVRDVPIVDGQAGDLAWQNAVPIQTLDYSSQRPITMRAVRDQTRIYLMIQYPDQAPSVTHKSWKWDAKDDYYKQGIDREDMFVIKWSMQGNEIDMRLRNASPHVADVWFWKACRTNPMGYWDDKRHEMTTQQVARSLAVRSESGRVGYLRRIADTGKPVYTELFPSSYLSEYVPRFLMNQSTGSRADVKGKGRWEAGEWTLECQRLLDTGNEDDLAMESGGQYLLGVSCYEMAGKGVKSELAQPLYRTGDIFDRILLVMD